MEEEDDLPPVIEEDDAASTDSPLNFEQQYAAMINTQLGGLLQEYKSRIENDAQDDGPETKTGKNLQALMREFGNMRTRMHLDIRLPDNRSQRLQECFSNVVQVEFAPFQERKDADDSDEEEEDLKIEGCNKLYIAASNTTEAPCADEMAEDTLARDSSPRNFAATRDRILTRLRPNTELPPEEVQVKREVLFEEFESGFFHLTISRAGQLVKEKIQKALLRGGAARRAQKSYKSLPYSSQSSSRNMKMKALNSRGKTAGMKKYPEKLQLN